MIKAETMCQFTFVKENLKKLVLHNLIRSGLHSTLMKLKQNVECDYTMYSNVKLIKLML